MPHDAMSDRDSSDPKRRSQVPAIDWIHCRTSLGADLKIGHCRSIILTAAAHFEADAAEPEFEDLRSASAVHPEAVDQSSLNVVDVPQT